MISVIMPAVLRSRDLHLRSLPGEFPDVRSQVVI